MDMAIWLRWNAFGALFNVNKDNDSWHLVCIDPRLAP